MKESLQKSNIYTNFQNEINSQFSLLNESRSKLIRICFPDSIKDGMKKLSSGTNVQNFCKTNLPNVFFNGRLYADKYRDVFILPIGKNNHNDIIKGLKKAIKNDGTFDSDVVTIEKQIINTIINKRLMPYTFKKIPTEILCGIKNENSSFHNFFKPIGEFNPEDVTIFGSSAKISFTKLNTGFLINQLEQEIKSLSQNPENLNDLYLDEKYKITFRPIITDRCKKCNLTGHKFCPFEEATAKEISECINNLLNNLEDGKKK